MSVFGPHSLFFIFNLTLQQNKKKFKDNEKDKNWAYLTHLVCNNRGPESHGEGSRAYQRDAKDP